MPFLGVIVLYRGRSQLKHLKTYLNTDLGLTFGSTLNNLKEAIHRRSNELAFQCPFVSQPRLGVSLYNLTVSSPIQASLVIEMMYFGTPAGINISIASNYPGRIHSNMPYTRYGEILDYDGATYDIDLKNIYREYREKAKNILDSDPHDDISPLKDVFNQMIEYRNARGGVDFVSTNYFYNPSNPDIPQQFRPQQYLPQQGIWAGLESEEILKKSTKIPLAWMIVEVGCNTFRRRRGGKTRRNKLRRKQNKSRRRITQTTH